MNQSESVNQITQRALMLHTSKTVLPPLYSKKQNIVSLQSVCKPPTSANRQNRTAQHLRLDIIESREILISCLEHWRWRCAELGAVIDKLSTSKVQDSIIKGTAETKSKNDRHIGNILDLYDFPLCPCARRDRLTVDDAASRSWSHRDSSCSTFSVSTAPPLKPHLALPWLSAQLPASISTPLQTKHAKSYMQMWMVLDTDSTACTSQARVQKRL